MPFFSSSRLRIWSSWRGCWASHGVWLISCVQFLFSHRRWKNEALLRLVAMGHLRESRGRLGKINPPAYLASKLCCVCYCGVEFQILACFVVNVKKVKNEGTVCYLPQVERVKIQPVARWTSSFYKHFKDQAWVWLTGKAFAWYMWDSSFHPQHHIQEK